MITNIIKQKTWIAALALLLAALFLHQPAHAQAGAITIDLCATAGSADILTGTSVTVWGYTLGDCTVNTTPELPGPTLEFVEGDAVEVVLHNNLAESTALLFQGQAMIPDLSGVAAGGTFTYTFTAAQPGTFLYEAGLLPNAQHQVAMGMAGVMIVRPAGAPGQAYADPATAFTVEAPLVLSEIDPTLNNSVDPAVFDMRDFKPRYWLINGKAYPDTAAIATVAADTVLLRVVNAGLLPHSMGLLGLDQTLLATDGNPLPFRRDVVVQTVAPGQTMDFLVDMPALAPAGGAQYALYDTNLLLHNSGAAGFGGMMTFIDLADGGPPPGAGPTTTSVSVLPNPTDGSLDVTLTATIPGASSAECFIDAQGAGGTGIAMTAGVNPGVWEATISVADLAGLAAGDHTLYVHGSDGTWGPFNYAILHLDKLGPLTQGLALTPNPSNGSVNVVVSATGNDSTTGNSNVVAAEYFVDTAGADGTGTAMTVTPIAPIASLGATIPAGLPAGAHTVYVHSQDAFGQWGDLVTATLGIDQTGPETGNLLLRPNPNNGTLPYSPSQYSLRVDATISDTLVPDVQSNIKKAEGFIDTVGADGSGFPLTPKDGLFNEVIEDAYVYIPLPNINVLPEGTHQIWIHGQDVAGNWGTAVAADLIIDKTAPTVSNVSAAPNPTGDAITTTLIATAGDTATDIVMAEWFDGADPGPGNGTAMAVAFNGTDWDLSAVIDVSLWAPGDHTLSVRARDAAGNWSAAATYVLYVVMPDGIFADSFEGNLLAWSSATGNLTTSPAAVMGNDGGTEGLVVTLAGNTPGYVTDLTPAAETTYRARFYLNPNGTLTANNNVVTVLAGRDAADADVVRVEYRRRNAQGGTYEVRGWVQTAGGAVTTNWFVINNNAANAIEIAWESGAAASFSLYVHGGLQQTLTGLDTSAYTVESALLGPSAGLNNSAAGTMYFDAFVSRRYTVIGP
jgi:FtsP/CotA-like multicopper oxidase with cupredoxin domain